jgi:hypothetical protein
MDRVQVNLDCISKKDKAVMEKEGIFVSCPRIRPFNLALSNLTYLFIET